MHITINAREAVGSLMGFFLSFGALLQYVVGPYTSYLVLIISSSIAPVLLGITFLFMPESPYYDIFKNKYEKSRQALIWLRRTNDSNYIQKELTDIETYVRETTGQRSGFKQLIEKKGNRKALCLSIGVVALQQLSGINYILFYMESIFQNTGTEIKASICGIIVGVVQTISSAFGPPLAAYFSMKCLLIYSSIGMMVSLGALAIYFTMMYQNIDVSRIKLLPIACLNIHIVTYSFGFGPLPRAIMGQVLATNVKAIGSAITASFTWIVAFLVSKYCQPLEFHVAFFIFAGCSFTALLFTVFILPKTFGMTFQEIQVLLNGGRQTTNA